MQEIIFFNSIEEVFLSVKTIESSIKTTLSVDYYSPAGLELIKKLILLCTSASITLLQQDTLSKTLSLLKTADWADSKLSRYSDFGLYWPGRLIMPNTLAFLYFKQQRYTDSLKFLYQSNSLSEEIINSGNSVNIDLQNLTNILTFMVLWKLNRYSESEKYIDSILDFDLKTIRGRNLFSLVAVCKAGIAAKRDKNYIYAIVVCNEAIKRTKKDQIIRDFIEQIIKSLQNESRNEGADLEINIKYRYDAIRNNTNHEDWLVNQSFITIFYVNCFLPIIPSEIGVIKIEPGWKNTEIIFPIEYNKPITIVKRSVFSASRKDDDKKLPNIFYDDLSQKNHNNPAFNSPFTDRKFIKSPVSYDLTEIFASKAKNGRERMQNAYLINFFVKNNHVKGYSEGYYKASYLSPKFSYFSPRVESSKRPRSSKVALNARALNRISG
ncbi:hypothetical protein SteCoe_30370 [Stentor coeruleus]|uniref:Uncharacterized protein n=1 Tax=Stentor coeruleus TaxID=5963 RepID=A0A1R2B475_9CILI|nr:hypothetical protein SteCoe_30370 [Stentor coeruleus]